MSAEISVILTEELKGYDEQPLTWEDNRPITIGDVCCRSLVSPEPGLSEDDIEARFAFAEMLANKTEHKFDPVQLALVRKRIKMTYQAPAIAAPALRVLSRRPE